MSKPSIVQPEPTSSRVGTWWKTGQGEEQVGVVAEVAVGVYVVFGDRDGDRIAAVGSQGIQVDVKGLPEAGLALSWSEFAEMVNWWKQQTGR
jgi:hypothetical protein